MSDDVGGVSGGSGNADETVETTERDMAEQGIPEIDVCVLGDSLPALAAALECAEVGLRVRLLFDPSAADGAGRAGSADAANAAVGSGAGDAVDALPLDWPRDPERDPDGVLAALLAGMTHPITPGSAPNAAVRAVRVPARSVVMRNAAGEWSPVPQPSVFGVPAVTVSTETLAFLSFWSGVRAYLDRVKPLLTVGKTHDFGKLVTSRLGATVRERLFEPLVRERFGAPDVEVAIAAPGLNEALTRAGSLSAAVLAYSDRQAARETRVVPAGGWGALREAMIERLRLFGAEFARPSVGGHTDAAPQITAGDDGVWLITEPTGVTAARALIVSVTVDPADALPGAVAEVVADRFAPEVARRLRVRAVVPIRDPELSVLSDAGLGEALQADAVHSDEIQADAVPADAVQTVALPDGALWSVRICCAEGGDWQAEARGPARDSPVAQFLEEQHVAIVDVRAALAAAGLVETAEPRIELRAAPFASVANREAARAADQTATAISAEEGGADPSLLITGRAIHGDDLAAAVADALAHAVPLRRRLAGIAD